MTFTGDFMAIARILSEAPFKKQRDFREFLGYVEISEKEDWTNQYLYDLVYNHINHLGRFVMNNYNHYTNGSIVRKPIGYNPYGFYDIIADEYQNWFKDPESIEEDRELISKFDIKGTVLDIGCGSGLLMDYVDDIDPTKYCGIDPSDKMLRYFVDKHPAYGNSIFPIAFEDFYVPTKFDTIISMYGSCNYIKPHAYERIPKFLNDGGKAYLVIYNDDYYPVTHVKGNVDFNFFKHSHVPFMGRYGVEVEIFHNYKLITLHA